jgi:DNA-binding beta-propeller fold protein YncE
MRSAKSRNPFMKTLKRTCLGVAMACTAIPVAASAAPTVEVVAEGLANPRGLAISPDGALYISEAGRGGEGPCIPGYETPVQCYGATGRVSRVKNGVYEVVADGLPSVGDPGSGDGAAGPNHLSLHGGSIHVVTSGFLEPERRIPLEAVDQRFGKLFQVSQGGAVTLVADVSAFEVANNPDQEGVESNPYGVLAEEGSRFVCDAAANALLEVKANGGIRTVATFPTDRSAPLPWAPNVVLPVQAVPTQATRGPDGALYVGELTGFPYPKGVGRVYRVTEDGAVSIYAQGFTNVLDVEFGPDGSLYVLELATNSLVSGDVTGAVKRVAPGGGAITTVLSEGLVLPTALAVDAAGDFLYVTNRGTSGSQGQVLRISL